MSADNLFAMFPRAGASGAGHTAGTLLEAAQGVNPVLQDALLDVGSKSLAVGVAIYGLTKGWNLVRRFTMDEAPYEGRHERWAKQWAELDNETPEETEERDPKSWAELDAELRELRRRSEARKPGPANATVVEIDAHGLPHQPPHITNRRPVAQGWDK